MFLLLLLGCSGPPSGRGLAALERDDVQSLCEDFSSREAELTCDDETVTVFGDQQSCEDDLAGVGAFCESTVGDLRNCVDALEEDGCDADLEHPACVELLDPECGLTLMLNGLIGSVGGLPDSTLLNDLDADAWLALCESIIDPLQGPTECDGFTIEPPTVLDCVEGSDIEYQDDCTLGLWFACAEREPAELCDVSDLGPCETFISDCLL